MIHEYMIKYSCWIIQYVAVLCCSKHWFLNHIYSTIVSNQMYLDVTIYNTQLPTYSIPTYNYEKAGSQTYNLTIIFNFPLYTRKHARNKNFFWFHWNAEKQMKLKLKLWNYSPFNILLTETWKAVWRRVFNHSEDDGQGIAFGMLQIFEQTF